MNICFYLTIFLRIMEVILFENANSSAEIFMVSPCVSSGLLITICWNCLADSYDTKVFPAASQMEIDVPAAWVEVNITSTLACAEFSEKPPAMPILPAAAMVPPEISAEIS